MAVEVVVRVVVIVRAVGVAREAVVVRSRREIRVVVTLEVEVGPGQRGRGVERGGVSLWAKLLAMRIRSWGY